MIRSNDNSDGRLAVDEERGLIRAAQLGCKESARRLILAHQDRLSAFIYRMIRDRHDTEEVCQEAFLRAFGALRTFDFQHRFSTWLFTIAYRLCLNAMRKSRDYAGGIDFTSMASTHRHPATEADDDVPDSVANTDEARRLRDVIWNSVEELTPHQRAAVLLFYREQMSCQQIGEVLDMPAATVKSHLHRARLKLRETLAGRMADGWSSVRFDASAG